MKQPMKRTIKKTANYIALERFNKAKQEARKSATNRGHIMSPFERIHPSGIEQSYCVHCKLSCLVYRDGDMTGSPLMNDCNSNAKPGRGQS